MGTTLGLIFTCDVITFHPNSHFLYSTSVRGNDLSNDTQIRVIGSMEPKICMKLLRHLKEKLKAKFPATIRGYSSIGKIHVSMVLSQNF